MSRRLFSLVTAVYPRSWRDRYAEELSDLCEDFADRGEARRLHLAAALLLAGIAERSRSVRLSRSWQLLSGGAVLAIVAGALIFATNGFGNFGSGPPARGALQSVQLHLGPGHTQATSRIREPRGFTVLARISAPRGLGVSAVATIPGSARVAISTVPSANEATWQLQVAKQSGPAALVSVDLVVSPQPAVVPS
jgi:hypothetical protein